MTTPAQQAQAALLSFGRNGRLEDRTYYGNYQLGESPHDNDYLVWVTLSATYEARLFTVRLSVTEYRYRDGQATLRHGRDMPFKVLGEWPASRFSAKRAETLYTEALKQLRADPTPLIELLQEESERS